MIDKQSRKKLCIKLAPLLAAAAGSLCLATTASAQTLENVKKAGAIKCGVSQGVSGFSNPDDQGNWSGLDVDFCRAMSAAIFNDPDKVEYSPLSAKVRFTALQSGEIDVLARNTTWTFSRDNSLGLEFVGVNYYDGQGFMVPKELGVSSAKDLDGAAICTNTGTTTELNAADFFRTNDLSYTIVAFEKMDDVVAAYDAGRCDVFTSDRSALAAWRTRLSKPDTHMLLPEVISKEPLGPVVRHGDNHWGDIARWTLNALIVAEELGITSENVDQLMNSENPEIRRFLGQEGDFGEQLGMGTDWAANMIRSVGNYGEIFDRNIGPNTPLQLDRGVNALWNKGGILYAPPIR